EGLGCVLRVPDVEVRGLALAGIDREGLRAQPCHARKPRARRLGNLAHGLFIETVAVTKRDEYADHSATPFLSKTSSIPAWTQDPVSTRPAPTRGRRRSRACDPPEPCGEA